MSNKEIMLTDTTTLDVVNKALSAITNKHKKVSNIKTPKPFIKKKMGMEYVE